MTSKVPPAPCPGHRLVPLFSVRPDPLLGARTWASEKRVTWPGPASWSVGKAWALAQLRGQPCPPW